MQISPKVVYLALQMFGLIITLSLIEVGQSAALIIKTNPWHTFSPYLLQVKRTLNLYMVQSLIEWSLPLFYTIHTCFKFLMATVRIHG